MSRQVQVWRIAAALTALLAACDDGTGVTTLSPKIVFVPEAGTNLAFEEVVLTRNRAPAIALRVGNDGTGLLDLREVFIEGDSQFFQLLNVPETLAAGEADAIFLKFEPGAPADLEATLVIRSNDKERPEVRFPLDALAREPCVLFADQSRMFFAVGQTQQLRISSISTQECVIDRIGVDREIFPIMNEPSIPYTLGPGEELVLDIQHNPVKPNVGGVPIRELKVRETDGTEVTVLLEGEAPLSGCLSIFPGEVLFPTTQVGNTRDMRVTVFNDCGRSAAISNALISKGWTEFEVSSGPYPTVIEALSAVDVWVRYYPMSRFGDQGTLIINTNDAENPRFRIPLFGDAAVPEIEYFPQFVDFGVVIYRDQTMTGARSECSSASRTIEVHNVGGAPLTISGFELDPAGDTDFQVASVVVEGTPVPNFTQPFEVPAASSAQVSLVFYPSHENPETHASELRIFHNAGPDPAVIRLQGTAAADGPVHDSFTQLEGPKVDILWVIDDSCSMFDEQEQLAVNLSQFIGYADSQNADYQMGVIVTDALSPEAGKLEHCYPYPRVVSHSYPEREEAFDCLFRVGTDGSYREAGLGAAMRAIQRSLSADQDPVRNPNVGLVRDDANLAIVIMSDEDDQSIESDSLLEAFFKSVKGAGGADRTTVHAIAGPTTERCDSLFAQPGYRYERMAGATGGTFYNICLEDWTPVLQGLGLNVFVPIDAWALSQAAVPGSVTVTVDGLPLVQSPGNGYTYDPQANTVRFHGTAVPGPGQRVDVNYLGNCQP